MSWLRMLSIVCFAVTCFVCAAMADGPPINENGVTVEHETLALTDEQSRQAGIYRYIELNDDQLEQLNEGRPGTRPRMLEIITYPFNECSCAIPFYGLWNSRNEVQIPSRLLDITEQEMAGRGTPPENLAEGCEDDLCIPYYRDMRSRKRHMGAEMLAIDCDGNVYQQGEKVGSLGKALKKADEKYARSGETRWIWIATPPFKHIEAAKKSFLEIRRFFIGNGYEVHSALSPDFAKQLKGEPE